MISNFMNHSSLESGEWIIHINPRAWDIMIEVWLIHKNGSKRETASIKDGIIELTEVKEGEAPKTPFLIVPQQVWQLIVDAMSEKTPPTKKTITEGKLEATQYHLEDLRKLLKLTNPTNKE